MAISINWASKVITVPQADLALVSPGLYELDVDAFRLALKDIEDSEVGMAFPATHRHNTQVVLSGVTYARTFEVINGYTVTFEDVGTPYTVRCAGANHNIVDVKTINQVSLIIGNSAGLQVVETGVSGLTPAESALLNGIASIPTDTLALLLANVLKANVKQVNDVPIKGAGVPGNTWGPA